jgi:hypothetical protein
MLTIDGGPCLWPESKVTLDVQLLLCRPRATAVGLVRSGLASTGRGERMAASRAARSRVHG